MNRKDQDRLIQMNNRNNGAITLVKEKPKLFMSKQERMQFSMDLKEVLDSVPEGHVLVLTPPPHRIDINFKSEQ